jgi:hypothetical protein
VSVREPEEMSLGVISRKCDINKSMGMEYVLLVG